MTRAPSHSSRRKRIDHLYRPRALQAEVHRSLKRFNVLVCHRRFGKTVMCINQLIASAAKRGATHERPRYAYIAPLYKQAKAVAWDYLKAYTSNIPGIHRHEAELRVDMPNGARISLYGADNPDALRGLYLDGVVLDEYAHMRPVLWGEVIRPAIADREGYAIFIGTPAGRNEFHRIYEVGRADAGWFAARYRVSETGVLPADELAQARKQMTPEQYEQEFECSFQAAILGAYYGKLLGAADAEGRIGCVPWEPSVPVYTAWDLGIGDSTTIWFAQAVGRELRLIDYYEASGEALAHYVKRLKEKPYIYGEHFAPHDISVRELGTGKSRLEVARELGIRFRIVPKLPVDDGINAVRAMIPKCWFDAEKCSDGIEALRRYRSEFDERRRVFAARPLHDWTSHPADAFRYLSLGLDERPRKVPGQAKAEDDYAILGG